MLVYTGEHEINVGIIKNIEIKTTQEFKIRYGNSYVYIPNPRSVMMLIAQDFAYVADKKIFELKLNIHRDIALIQFTKNYKMDFTGTNGFDTLGTEFKKDRYLSIKLFSEERRDGEHIIFTMNSLAMDILNIIKNYGINNRAW